MFNVNVILFRKHKYIVIHHDYYIMLQLLKVYASLNQVEAFLGIGVTTAPFTKEHVEARMLSAIQGILSDAVIPGKYNYKIK